MVIAVVSLSVIPVGAQTSATATTAKRLTVPRTADGQPDLQGVWDYRTLTPMERPSELAGKQVLTEEEAAAFEKRTLVASDADRRDADPSREGLVNGAPATADVARAYNQFWMDRGSKVVGTKRTSLIIDPPDGRIPPLTAEGKKRTAALAAARERPAVGPEDRSVGERCIMGFNAGPPMTPGGYNNNFLLLQVPGYVVILNEMVHSTRIIPMDQRPHGDIRQWAGDSRGHWDGDTLVVETTNLRSSFLIASDALRLTERFTRVGPNTLQYAVTVDDPHTWTRPWTLMIPLKRSEQHIYEYACHEGNYGLAGILAGARADDRKAAEAGTQKR
jgi:hypothetical protein